MAYTTVVARRMQKQTAYRPGLEDWTFQVGLPFAAYGLLVLSALGGIESSLRRCSRPTTCS